MIFLYNILCKDVYNVIVYIYIYIYIYMHNVKMYRYIVKCKSNETDVFINFNAYKVSYLRTYV